MDLLLESKIKPGYRTDHSICLLTIALNKFTRGNGYWKFNCSLLKNQNYVNLVNRTIEDEKKKYIPPVYAIDSINNIKDCDIHFTISDSLFLEMLILRIRGETIKFSSNLKKKSNKEEERLIKDIEYIERNDTLMQLSDLLDDKKLQLQEIRLEKMKDK